MMKSRDRFSELPDGIIGRILSFVDTKSAVGTTVLSRRWKNLVWNSLSTLHFDDSNFPNLSKFENFVKNVLKRRDKSVTLTKFIYISKRTTPNSQTSTSKFVRMLLGFAANESLEHLQLSMPVSGFDLSPNKLNHNSLTSLKLQVLGNSNIVRSPVIDSVLGCLPELRILHLEGFEFDETELLSTCENLVELSLVMTNSQKSPLDKLTICAPQLVRLKIVYYSSQNKVITLKLPKLAVFKFKSSGGIPFFCTAEFFHLNTGKVKFGKNISAVKQDLLLNLLQKLCYAQHLTLSLPTFEYLNHFGVALEDPFSNLKTLTITTKEGNMHINSLKPLRLISTKVINHVLNTVFQTSNVEHFIDLSGLCKAPEDLIQELRL